MMQDPPRLLDGPLSPIQRTLLEGARSEQPDDAATSKMLAGLTMVGFAGGMGPGPSPGGTESLAPAAQALGGGVAKWLGGLALACCAGSGVWWGWSQAAHRDAAEGGGVESRAGAVENGAVENGAAKNGAAQSQASWVNERQDGWKEQAPISAASALAEKGSALNEKGSGISSDAHKPLLRTIKAPAVDEHPQLNVEPLGQPSSTVTAEIATLSRVRDAIQAQDAPMALRLLKEYRRSFPRGVLRPEAGVLSARAAELMSSGNNGTGSP